MFQDGYNLSHFLRHSGEVLDAVEARDVVLHRRGTDDLLLTTLERGRTLRDALALLGATTLEALRGEEGRDLLERSFAVSHPWTSNLLAPQRTQLLSELAGAATTAAQLGVADPLVRVLDRWRRTARERASAQPTSAHLTRPVAIPDDVDDPAIDKVKGTVELPLRVRWSIPRRSYDLSNPRDLCRVYEQVLREGTEEDVRRFIDVDVLVAHWDELVLPPRVRRAWADWLRRRRNIDLACAQDARIFPTEPSPLGPTLAPEELAADKVLTLFTRAESRDYVDVYFLAQRYGKRELCQLALQKDTGFDEAVFAEMLGAIQRLDAEEFEIDEDELPALRAFFAGWRTELQTGS